MLDFTSLVIYSSMKRSLSDPLSAFSIAEITCIWLNTSVLSGTHLREIGRGESAEEKETSVLPGPKVSVENFLSRLPASVVKGGRVLDVRAGVAEVLHVSNDYNNYSVNQSLVLMGQNGSYIDHF